MLLWYEIRDELGQGGFGITYLAFDQNLERWVAIKEYLPHEFATRRQNDSTIHPLTKKYDEIYHWGLDRFMVEAKTLARFKHPNIVRVHSVFDQNNTAYMVMEYEQGKELAHYINQGVLKSENELLAILIPLLDGLELVHSTGFIHRDIKPSNIYIRDDHSPVLLDFGSARQALNNKTRTLTSLVSPGFAPFEQYHQSEEHQGPWTDIYALGATAYYAITGEAPVDAMVRGRALLSNAPDPLKSAVKAGSTRYSKQFLTAIDCALIFKEQDRPQSAGEWKQMLLGEIPMPATEDSEPVRAPKSPLTTESEFISPLSTEPRLESIANISAQRPHSQKYFFLSIVLIGIITAVIASIYMKPVVIQAKLKGLVQQLTPAGSGKQKASDLEQRIFQLLLQAEKSLEVKKWRDALESYQEVIKLDPRNEQAKQGITRVTDHSLDLAAQAIETGNFNQARNHLNNAARISPLTDRARELQAKLSVQERRESKRQNELSKKLEAEAIRKRSEFSELQKRIDELKANVTSAKSKADEFNARYHAARLYRDALLQSSQAGDLVSLGQEFNAASEFDEALDAMKRGLELLNQAQNDFAAAHHSAELQMQRKAKAKQQRAEIRELEISLYGYRDRLSDAKFKADSVNAETHAVELYLEAEGWSQQAEELISMSTGLKQNAAFDEAINTIKQAINLLERAELGFVNAQQSAEEYINLQFKKQF